MYVSKYNTFCSANKTIQEQWINEDHYCHYLLTSLGLKNFKREKLSVRLSDIDIYVTNGSVGMSNI